MAITELPALTLNLKLDEAARQLNRPRHPKTIHASSFFECGLKQFWQLTGQEPTDLAFEPEWEISASVGNTIHNHIQQRLVQAGIAYMVPSFTEDPRTRAAERSRGVLQPAIELPLSEYTLPAEQWAFVQSHRLGGRIDAIVNTIDGGQAIFEIKTIAAKYLDRPDYRNYFGDKLSHYEMQVQSYLHVYRTPDGRKLERGLIYVVNQGNFKDVRLFSVAYNPDFMTTEFERLHALKQAIDRQEAPEPENHRGPCRFCQFRSICPNPARAG